MPQHTTPLRNYIGPAYKAFYGKSTPIEITGVPLPDSASQDLTLNFLNSSCKVNGWQVDANVCEQRVSFVLDLDCDQANRLDPGSYIVSIQKNVGGNLITVHELTLIIVMP